MGKKAVSPKMKRTSVLLPELYIMDLESRVDEGMYPNRNEAIFMAIRNLVDMELPLTEEEIRLEPVAIRKLRILVPDKYEKGVGKMTKEGYFEDLQEGYFIAIRDLLIKHSLWPEKPSLSLLDVVKKIRYGSSYNAKGFTSSNLY